MLVNFDSEEYAQLEINAGTGLIERVGRNLGSPDLKLKHELVFPGFVDVHVHAREDMSGKQNYKETFRTLSEAAINGGVVFVADMPNNTVAPVDDKSYKEKFGLTKSSLIDVLLYAGIGPETLPLTFNVPYKVFMGPSVGGLFFSSQELFKQVLMRYCGADVSFHCEDPEVLELNKAAKTHELRRPREAEVLAIGVALDLIKKYDLKGKICHCSIREGLENILQAKQKGVNVTCEVTPHHLYFDEGVLTHENHKWFQANPPLRTLDDRVALIDGLRSGFVDYLATDHAPHTCKEKEMLASGIPHLDTYGGFVTWLMKAHSFAPQDIARVCSYNPGCFVNKFADMRFGKIMEGYAGSLTVIDMLSPKRVSKLKTRCGWSPFGGVIAQDRTFSTAIVFPGSVVYTVVKGKVYRV